MIECIKGCCIGTLIGMMAGIAIGVTKKSYICDMLKKGNREIKRFKRKYSF